MHIRKIGSIVLASAFIISTGSAVAQDGAKQDMKTAGTDTKNAAKDTGHAVSTGSKKAYNKTATGTKTAADKTATGTKTAYHKTENGTKTATETQQRVLPWWRSTPTGGFAFFIRSGSKAIEFEKGKAAIAVPSLDKLPSVIDTLMNAVRGGELDDQLAQARRY